jgi:hypothetical protein
MKWSFLLVMTFVVSVGLSMGSESPVNLRENGSLSLEERLKALRGNDGSWRIPDSVGGSATTSERQGLRSAPLSIHDVSGERLGEVYQLRSASDYVGLLLVANQRGKARGLSSGFSEAEWPLDRVSREVTLNDLDNTLFEPKYYLILDENRLLLRVNLGKKELELDGISLNADEIGRGKSRLPGRVTER